MVHPKGPITQVRTCALGPSLWAIDPEPQTLNRWNGSCEL